MSAHSIAANFDAQPPSPMQSHTSIGGGFTQVYAALDAGELEELRLALRERQARLAKDLSVTAGRALIDSFAAATKLGFELSEEIR